MKSPLAVFGRAVCPAFIIASNGRIENRQGAKKFSGRLLKRQGRGLGFFFFNLQSNPQIEWSCTTCVAFGSPRVVLSCCKADKRGAVTAGRRVRDPPSPQIIPKELIRAATLREAWRPRG